jgi:hypothetical protein
MAIMEPHWPILWTEAFKIKVPDYGKAAVLACGLGASALFGKGKHICSMCRCAYRLRKTLLIIEGVLLSIKHIASHALLPDL